MESTIKLSNEKLRQLAVINTFTEDGCFIIITIIFRSDPEGLVIIETNQARVRGSLYEAGIAIANKKNELMERGFEIKSATTL